MIEQEKVNCPLQLFDLPVTSPQTPPPRYNDHLEQHVTEDLHHRAEWSYAPVRSTPRYYDRLEMTPVSGCHLIRSI